MYKQLLVILFSLLAMPTMAQTYPAGYFRSPLNIPILLAGNFGECRPNHFHSGLDIKTNGKENLPILAVADGYISRIKMEPGGFGHALYVTHPNGYTSLYAHLNDFMPEVQQHVRAEQYKNESWTLDLQLPASQFPVKKGQQIAWSGNTGSSTAPHLHFEIRDNKTEHPLNPMLFGFDIDDKIPPVIHRLAVYNLSGSIYEQSPQLFSVKKKGERYVIEDTITADGTHIGLGLQTDDYMNGSESTLTFYKASVTVDGIPFGVITLDDIGYDVTRYQHAYIDYKTKKQSGILVQLLFQLKGNMLNSIYEWNKNNKGNIDISDNKTHSVVVELLDAANNKTGLSFFIRNTKDNKVDTCSSGLYHVGDAMLFMHPDTKRIDVKLTLPYNSVYDDICFSHEAKADANALSDRHRIHYSYVPVHAGFDLYIKPNKAIGFDQRSKVAMVYNDGKEETGKAASTDEVWYKASVRNFGEYRLVLDIVPPEIKTTVKDNAILSKATRINFVAKDEITSVKKFRGTLDGKWICFEQHGDNFFYTFDGHCPKGKHKLAFTATDENGNSKTIHLNFTR